MEKYQTELESYEKKLKEYSVDLDKWKSIQTETEQKRKELKVKVECLKEELLCNRVITFAEGKANINSKEIFGEIIVKDTGVRPFFT